MLKNNLPQACSEKYLLQSPSYVSVFGAIGTVADYFSFMLIP